MACDNPDHSMLRDAVRAQDAFIAAQTKALRELVGYCREHATYSAAGDYAYADVAERLEAVLGMSTVVETEVDPGTGLDKG